ncbi:hypothetical protein SDJN03_03924, partial [Cucurbita argyrosperma subsp. sororia]
MDGKGEVEKAKKRRRSIRKMGTKSTTVGGGGSGGRSRGSTRRQTVQTNKATLEHQKKQQPAIILSGNLVSPPCVSSCGWRVVAAPAVEIDVAKGEELGHGGVLFIPILIYTATFWKSASLQFVLFFKP